MFLVDSNPLPFPTPPVKHKIASPPFSPFSSELSEIKDMLTTVSKELKIPQQDVSTSAVN